MPDLGAVGVWKPHPPADGERVPPRRRIPLLLPWFLLLFVVRRLSASNLSAPRRRGARCRRVRAPQAPPPADDPGVRLDQVARWIGGPVGRGRVVPRAPAAGVREVVRVWDASGELTTRGIRVGRRLGAGLAGTVFEVEDDSGVRFVEKHYGEIPSGIARFDRRLANAVFSLFRQAPLSFRELAEAVFATHLANGLIVEASKERFGCSITPPLLYTRYDARTGGYVQAFAKVEGRPLRPAAPGLPLLGEAAVVLPIMRRWRDFLAQELGFWGLARQVDPANVNAYSNVWVTPDRHVVLLDLVPGIPGFLEPRYVWWGIRRGQFAPFADAVDFERLAHWLESHPTRQPDRAREDLDLLRVAVDRWQASEPRLVSSPLRPVRMLTDPRIRAGTRRALLTHLEVKGVVSPERARDYRGALVATGRFPQLRRHSLLKMAPLPLHRALVDRSYAWQILRRLPRLAPKLARMIAAAAAWIARRVTALVVTLVKHLASSELRMQTFRARMGGWIDSELRLGRLTQAQAGRLRDDVNDDDETAHLAGVFVVHLGISALKHSLLGPSLFWIGLALATETWWLVLPAMVAPLLRVAAAASMGFARRPGLLALCALPDIGVLATPLYLIQRRREVGAFIVRAFAQRIALSVPALGQRGGLVEMAAVAAVEVFVVGPARVLPWAFVAAVSALLLSVWWAALAALSLYLAAVTSALIRQPYRRERATATAQPGWRVGLPGAVASRR